MCARESFCSSLSCVMVAVDVALRPSPRGATVQLICCADLPRVGGSFNIDYLVAHLTPFASSARRAIHPLGCTTRTRRSYRERLSPSLRARTT